ncbi:wax ester/triacylglycerol synthase family O-acyltransferase [Solirubrobacter ginsenosidimutans]|uniref:Diacylglycerol O-acyltransferase n=1 Tax=Solirubrobacter ginsenosidimutans TaxID=490573 RepID=A0A9X3MU29_9ACTN|nr:wax ester/triacylglycerol synthase family O-acyltransferase [Solirubrobacter ginsenosidimutans]MDA0159683.1 wax ester/triacylglycerol synthase family O-acyltransferase [Solirubrobacter ginsenosidimutans]
MRQLSTLDAQFLNVESARIYGHVAFLGIYDPTTAPGGKLGGAEVKQLLEDRLHLLPPLRWRLVQVPLGLDLPYWVDDPDFDLEFHIRETAIPAPGDDRQLAETVQRVFGRPLDRGRPLWELYVIHGLEGGRVALLTKIHHSVVDGISGNEIMAVLLDPEPTGRYVEPKPAKTRPAPPLPRDRDMLARGLRGIPRQPLRALRSLPTTIAGFTDLPGANALPGVPTLSHVYSAVRRTFGADESAGVLEVTKARPPKTPFNGPVSAHRRFAFGSLSLDSVRQVRREFGTTVNDVVVTLCAGAVRDWLIERDALPEDPLVALIPMSVRKRDERGAWGNRISMMIVPIPTNEPDPAERLRRTHEYLRSAKERHSALPASLLTDATAFIPPAVASLAARNTVDILSRTRPPLNLVISNVPGPRTSLYCAGAEMVSNFPVSVIVDGVGLNITVVSYKDRVDFGIVGDREQIDDAWAFLEGAAHALTELEEIGKTRR